MYTDYNHRVNDKILREVEKLDDFTCSLKSRVHWLVSVVESSQKLNPRLRNTGILANHNGKV